VVQAKAKGDGEHEARVVTTVVGRNVQVEGGKLGPQYESWKIELVNGETREVSEELSKRIFTGKGLVKARKDRVAMGNENEGEGLDEMKHPKQDHVTV